MAMMAEQEDPRAAMMAQMQMDPRMAMMAEQEDPRAAMMAQLQSEKNAIQRQSLGMQAQNSRDQSNPLLQQLNAMKSERDAKLSQFQSSRDDMLSQLRGGASLSSGANLTGLKQRQMEDPMASLKRQMLEEDMGMPSAGPSMSPWDAPEPQRRGMGMPRPSMGPQRYPRW